MPDEVLGPVCRVPRRASPHRDNSLRNATQNRVLPCRLSGLGATFLHIACGGAHSAVVSNAGQLYTFGAGSCGQLGHGAASGNALRPTLVSSLADRGVRVALASCGEEFTLAISDTQEVYACGLGNVGQMGCGTDESFSVPTLVPTMSGRGVEVATCGAAQVHAVSSDGKVWVWGRAGTDTSQMLDELKRNTKMDAAELARLAKGDAHEHGSAGAKVLPDTLPSEVAELKSKSVLRLEAGRRHFAALTAPASPILSELQVKEARLSDAWRHGDGHHVAAQCARVRHTVCSSCRYYSSWLNNLLPSRPPN